MEAEKLLDLISELQSKEFWGSLKVTFKRGKPVHVEMEQTITDDSEGIIVHRRRKTIIREA